MNLVTKPHPQPYKFQWLREERVKFSIRKYEDTITYDVVLMEACHLLLGRPCQYNKERKVTLTHLSPREVGKDESKMRDRRKQERKEKERENKKRVKRKR